MKVLQLALREAVSYSATSAPEPEEFKKTFKCCFSKTGRELAVVPIWNNCRTGYFSPRDQRERSQSSFQPGAKRVCLDGQS
jgi:hypothetical protein